MLDTRCGGKDKYSPFSHGADTLGDPQLKVSKQDHYQKEYVLWKGLKRMIEQVTLTDLGPG